MSKKSRGESDGLRLENEGKARNKGSMRGFLIALGVIGFLIAGIYIINIGQTNVSASGDAVAPLTGSAGAIGGQGGDSPQPKNQEANKAGSDIIRIPLSEISRDVRKYTYDTGRTAVKYIVVLGSDGVVRTAFDACEVCGGRKGYRQDGSDVVCNNCGKVFRIDDLGSMNTGRGCWPLYLPHTIDGDYVVVKKSDLQKEERFF